MKNDDTFYIPVVIHILLASPDIIGSTQIQSQLTAINNDFNAKNEDLTTIDPVFDTNKAAVGIEFFLADTSFNYDVNGVNFHATNNISYTSETLFSSEKGGVDPIREERYLNIWIADLAEPFFGFTTASGIGIDYKVFGTVGDLADSYNLGRTLTHELGHYFSLEHPWGLGGCEADDGIADTPNQDAAIANCSIPNESCGSLDMSQNFMNLAEDACLIFFTHGQRDQMRDYLSNTKAELIESEAPVLNTQKNEQDMLIYPTPSFSGQITFSNIPYGTTKIILRSLDGALIMSNQLKNGTYIYQMDVSTLKSGIYFCEIEMNKIIKRSRKIVLK